MPLNIHLYGCWCLACLALNGRRLQHGATSEAGAPEPAGTGSAAHASRARCRLRPASRATFQRLRTAAGTRLLRSAGAPQHPIWHMHGRRRNSATEQLTSTHRCVQSSSRKKTGQARPGARLRSVPAELLAQRQRRGVHAVRAPDLDDVAELLRLSLQARLRPAARSCRLKSNPNPIH